MDPRELGIRDEEIIPMNRDMTAPAKKVRRIYNLILRDPDDKSLQLALLDALLEWRDAVAKSEEISP